MGYFDNETAASDLSAAMQQPAVVTEIFQAGIEQSIALRKARRLPNIATGTARMSVMDLMPIAYIGSTPTTLKKTTKLRWKGKTLTVEDIHVIVPIAENTLADATNVNIWGEVTPRIGEAIGAIIDAAIFHGVGLPTTWLTDTAGTSRSLLAGAIAAGNYVQYGTNLDLYDDIFGSAGMLALVRRQGFPITGHAAPIYFEGVAQDLRANRTATGAGAPIFYANGNIEMFDRRPIDFSLNGGLDPDEALLFSGDWSQLVYSIRQDLQVKLLTEAVITDEEGDIVFNLPQQDMVALRLVLRMAWQIANPVTRLAATEATRYPFGVLTPAGT